MKSFLIPVFSLLLLTVGCNPSEKPLTQTSADSLTTHTEDHIQTVSASEQYMNTLYEYEYMQTYEGKLQHALTIGSDTIMFDNVIGISKTLVIENRNDLLITPKNTDYLGLIRFDHYKPLIEIRNCQNITFSSINFETGSYEALVAVSGSSNIRFENCQFPMNEETAVRKTGSSNILFENCTFVSSDNDDEQPSDNEAEGTEYSEPGEEGEEDVSDDYAENNYEASENESDVDDQEGEMLGEKNPADQYTAAWDENMNQVSVPGKERSMRFFTSNKTFLVENTAPMNYISYAVLEFGKDFTTPVNWSKENDTWKEGSQLDWMPDTCTDYQKVLSVTKTRRKLWYIHRKLSFEQETGIAGEDAWRDNDWFRNRAYYKLLFESRQPEVLAKAWELAKTYLPANVVIKDQRQKAEWLMFIDEMLLYYARIHKTPYWEDRFKYLTGSERNLTDGDYFYQAGFPFHQNTCMREGFTGGNYITGYDWGHESWMYSFWLRRYNEGNMEIVKEILFWAKGELSK